MKVKDLEFQEEALDGSDMIGGIFFFAFADAEASGSRLSFAKTKALSFSLSGGFGKFKQ